MGMRDDDAVSLDSHVELRGEAEQFDMAAYAAALAFNSAALPPNMPEWLKAAIEAKAVIIRDDPANPLSNTLSTERDAKEKRAKDFGDAALDQISLILRQEQQRERETWSHTASTVGGVTMTGAEWDKFAQRLRDDDDLRQRVIDAFKKRGMSDSEAEARYDRVAEIARIAAIPPSQRTPEENHDFSAAHADPTFNKDMGTAAQLTDSFRAPPISKLHQQFDQAASADAPPAPVPAISKAVPVISVDGPGF